MDVAALLVDGYGRVAEEVARVLDGADAELLTARPDDANSIGWLVWHLTRVQDDHLADAFDVPQLWVADGWAERFGLALPVRDTGYGHSGDQVAAVVAGADLLRGYHEAVHARSVDLLGALEPAALDRVVDTRWDPPVTLGVRLVSVLADDLQHVGQAAYLRGILERARS
ncbi:DinB family protein [Actinotalea sp. M2MS4P-6]|uniref:mycothiol transferase n=1 Tax=Actinotalea sp. M2MS4P-6 TaxID=2983762 RepID=UPI0021E45802|nr:DinB family protein [Actinotalea sp. M2MS4P-6]MCV2395881.1 DinB family protein [Actinotalea sp. M2MS4P-6]